MGKKKNSRSVMDIYKQFNKENDKKKRKLLCVPPDDEDEQPDDVGDCIMSSENDDNDDDDTIDKQGVEMEMKKEDDGPPVVEEIGGERPAQKYSLDLYSVINEVVRLPLEDAKKICSFYWKTQHIHEITNVIEIIHNLNQKCQLNISSENIHLFGMYENLKLGFSCILNVSNDNFFNVHQMLIEMEPHFIRNMNIRRPTNEKLFWLILKEHPNYLCVVRMNHNNNITDSMYSNIINEQNIINNPTLLNLVYNDIPFLMSSSKENPFLVGLRIHTSMFSSQLMCLKKSDFIHFQLNKQGDMLTFDIVSFAQNDNIYNRVRFPELPMKIVGDEEKKEDVKNHLPNIISVPFINYLLCFVKFNQKKFHKLINYKLNKIAVLLLKSTIINRGELVDAQNKWLANKRILSSNVISILLKKHIIFHINIIYKTDNVYEFNLNLFPIIKVN